MIRALLLALALAGCEGQVHVESVPIAQAAPPGRWSGWFEVDPCAPFILQADPTKEEDYPRLYDYYDRSFGSQAQPCSLTVTNATPRTLLLEQECVVTLAKPGSTQTVALEGSVTIREEASYDE